MSKSCPFVQPTSPTTPNKPLAPLDWASGVATKPDPCLVNKHIRKVVDVSLQTYFSKSEETVPVVGESNLFPCLCWESLCSGIMTMTGMDTFLKKTLRALQPTSPSWTLSAFWIKISEFGTLQYS